MKGRENGSAPFRFSPFLFFRWEVKVRLGLFFFPVLTERVIGGLASEAVF